MRLGKFPSILASAVFGLSAGSAQAAAPIPWRMGLQDPATPVMQRIADFHTLLLWIIIPIALFVTALLVWTMIKFSAKNNATPSKTTHNTLIEIVWTVIPIIILVFIAVPSFKLLYYEDVVPKADMTLKAIGHQWYWSYQYPDQGNFSFDSFIVEGMDAADKQKIKQARGAKYLRLLDTDTKVVVPVNTTVRVQVTADDVLHSWAVPAFGTKIDAVPGRLNETWFRVTREGTYYGQCSELCGERHGYMPIMVEVVSKEKFNSWVAERRRAAGLDPVPEKIAGNVPSDR